MLFAQLTSNDNQMHYTVNYVKAMVLNLWVADPKLGRLKISLRFFWQTSTKSETLGPVTMMSRITMTNCLGWFTRETDQTRGNLRTLLVKTFSFFLNDHLKNCQNLLFPEVRTFFHFKFPDMTEWRKSC